MVPQSIITLALLHKFVYEFRGNSTCIILDRSFVYKLNLNTTHNFESGCVFKVQIWVELCQVGLQSNLGLVGRVHLTALPCTPLLYSLSLSIMCACLWCQLDQQSRSHVREETKWLGQYSRKGIILALLEGSGISRMIIRHVFVLYLYS